MQSATDPDLIEKVKQGNINSFNQLVEKYKNDVFHLCMKILKNNEEAEEIAQDVFVKIYTDIKKFRGESRFSTWLFRITYNESLSRLRKNKKLHQQTELKEETFQMDYIEKEFHKVENEERTKIIDRSLDELDEENKTIILMFYYHEKPVEEIANIIGLSKTNVKTKLFRARKQLLTYFEKKLKVTRKEMI